MEQIPKRRKLRWNKPQKQRKLRWNKPQKRRKLGWRKSQKRRNNCEGAKPKKRRNNGAGATPEGLSSVWSPSRAHPGQTPAIPTIHRIKIPFFLLLGLCDTPQATPKCFITAGMELKSQGENSGQGKKKPNLLLCGFISVRFIFHCHLNYFWLCTDILKRISGLFSSMQNKIKLNI